MVRKGILYFLKNNFFPFISGTFLNLNFCIKPLVARSQKFPAKKTPKVKTNKITRKRFFKILRKK